MNIITSEIWKKSGVYCIICTRTGHRYVGSTTNLYQRLMKHRHNLRHNCHWSEKMQKEWNEYGEGFFEWYILCFAEGETLKEREKYYIGSLKAEFNMIQDPIHIKMPEESRMKMSISRKEGFKRGTVKLYQEKSIHQYSLQGEYIASYINIKEASRKSGVSRSTINRYLKGTYRKGGGYLWSLEKKDRLEPYTKGKISHPTALRKVSIVDLLTGEEIILPSRNALADYFKKSPSNFTYYFNHPDALYKKRYMIKDFSAV